MIIRTSLQAWRLTPSTTNIAGRPQLPSRVDSDIACSSCSTCPEGWHDTQFPAVSKKTKAQCTSTVKQSRRPPLHETFARKAGNGVSGFKQNTMAESSRMLCTQAEINPEDHKVKDTSPANLSDEGVAAWLGLSRSQIVVSRENQETDIDGGIRHPGYLSRLVVKRSGRSRRGKI